MASDEKGQVPPPLTKEEEANPSVADGSGTAPEQSGNNGQRPRLLCRFFARGQCTKGPNCTYSHNPNAPVEPARRNSGGQWNGQGPRSGSFDGGRRGSGGGGQGRSAFGGMVPCKFFMRNACHNGENCRYSHDPTVIAESMSRMQQGPMPGTLPPSFYHNGPPPMGGPMGPPMGYPAMAPFQGVPTVNPVIAHMQAAVNRQFSCEALQQNPLFMAAVAASTNEEMSQDERNEAWAKVAGGPIVKVLYACGYGRFEDGFTFLTPEQIRRAHENNPEYHAMGALERMIETSDISLFWSQAFMMLFTGTTGVPMWDTYYGPGPGRPMPGGPQPTTPTTPPPQSAQQ